MDSDINYNKEEETNKEEERKNKSKKIIKGVRIEEEHSSRRKKNIYSRLGYLSCLFIIYIFLLIGIRITIFIISIVKIVSEYKLFYLLLIISFIILLASAISICITASISGKLSLAIVVTLLLICYGINAFCYYLYINDEIDYKFFFILLIIGDSLLFPILVVSIIYLFCFCFDDI